MPTSTDLIQEVKDSVLGASFTDTAILRSLNKGIYRIAGMVFLPDLEASASVTTGVGNYASLPTDYHRGIQAAYDHTNETKLVHYESFLEFLNRYPGLGETGERLVSFSTRGTRIYFQPALSVSTTFTLYYHRKPTSMVAVAVPPVVGAQITPDGIPEHLAYDLLVPFAGMDLWRNIEQDAAQQPNVEKYTALFRMAMAELADFVEDEDGEPDYINQNWGGEGS